MASAAPALFGRAPVGKDVELGLVLFGFLGDAPDDLVAWRTPCSASAAHHYHQQRPIVDAVSDDALRLTPHDVRGRLVDWRSMVRPRLPPPSPVLRAPSSEPRPRPPERRVPTPGARPTVSPSTRSSGPPDGRPVLLLHGFPQTSFSWHHQLDALGGRRLPGVGLRPAWLLTRARPPAVEDYRIDDLVSDVLAVADELGMARFDLVGHDWGAMVSWVLTGGHPDRVRTLSAVSVPHPRAFAAAFARGRGLRLRLRSGSGSGSAQVMRTTRLAGRQAPVSRRRGGDADQQRRSSYIDVFRAEGGVAERALLGVDEYGAGLRTMFDASGLPSDTDEVRQFVATMLQPGALTAALNWYRATDPAVLTDVGAITVPTLYVWSTKDIALGRIAAEATVDWVSAPYRFEVLDGVSHWIPETAPDELNRLLLEHLAAHR